MSFEDGKATTFADLIGAGILQIGDGYRAENAELGGDGPIFLRAGHVTDTHIDFAGVDRFRAELAARVRPKMSKAGDVVVTTKGNSTGRVTYVTPDMPPFVYSPHLSYWRSADCNRLSSGFLRYWSRGREFTGQLLGLKASTDMAPYLSLADQKRLKVTLPPIEQQQAIAGVLGSLDDKIDLNRRMNETLEAIARTLFRSWFVDFDPVWAKQEGRQPPGLDAATATLFADSFEDSPLGPTPKGWEIRSFLDRAELISGGTPRTSEADYWDGNIAWASAKDVSQCAEAFLIDTERTITELGLTNSATKIIAAFSTVVVARGATTGRFTMFGRDIAMNQTCYALRSRTGHPFFLNCLFHQTVDGLVHAAHGSVFDTITTSTFERASVLAPPSPIISYFEEKVRELFRRILANQNESSTLASLRDVLLPKLLSGEIRVRDLETSVQ